MRDQAFGHCTGARCKGCQFIFLFLPFQYVEHRYSMLSIDQSVCSLCSWPKSMDQKWTALRPVAWTGTQLIIHIWLFFLLGFEIEFTISGIHQMFGLALLCLSFWAFYIFCVSVVGICLVGSDSTWCLRRRSCSEHSVQMVCCVCLRKQTSMTIRELWKVEKNIGQIQSLATLGVIKCHGTVVVTPQPHHPSFAAAMHKYTVVRLLMMLLLLLYVCNIVPECTLFERKTHELPHQHPKKHLYGVAVCSFMYVFYCIFSLASTFGKCMCVCVCSTSCSTSNACMLNE